MNDQLTQPPADLLAHFDALEPVLSRDKGGDQARRLAAYFEQAQLECQQIRLRSTDFEEKELLRIQGEAFAVSRRVLLASWNKLHGSELAL
jgi:hypothetical protein